MPFDVRLFVCKNKLPKYYKQMHRLKVRFREKRVCTFQVWVALLRSGLLRKAIFSHVVGVWLENTASQLYVVRTGLQAQGIRDVCFTLPLSRKSQIGVPLPYHYVRNWQILSKNYLLKVSKSRKQIMKLLILPKNEQNALKIVS